MATGCHQSQGCFNHVPIARVIVALARRSAIDPRQELDQPVALGYDETRPKRPRKGCSSGRTDSRPHDHGDLRAHPDAHYTLGGTESVRQIILETGNVESAEIDASEFAEATDQDDTTVPSRAFQCPLESLCCHSVRLEEQYDFRCNVAAEVAWPRCHRSSVGGVACRS